MIAAAVISAARTVCGNVTSCVEFVSTFQIDVSSTRPCRSTRPTGCCMKLFAARMKYALIVVPAAASQIVARCSRGLSRPRPKIHRPRNVDSRKNAISPSIASGAPKMSPTKREYTDQFMPNWNSCTMPVTTPRAKMTSMMRPQNRVARSQSSPAGVPRRRYASVCIVATSAVSPIDSGTIRK